jgi:TRAP-type C4-dicarboxylate transport system permease small subunit
MKTYKKIIRIICTVFEIVAAVSLGAMVVVVSIHIIMRYFFHNAPGWAKKWRGSL